MPEGAPTYSDVGRASECVTRMAIARVGPRVTWQSLCAAPFAKPSKKASAVLAHAGLPVPHFSLPVLHLCLLLMNKHCAFMHIEHLSSNQSFYFNQVDFNFWSSESFRTALAPRTGREYTITKLHTKAQGLNLIFELVRAKRKKCLRT